MGRERRKGSINMNRGCSRKLGAGRKGIRDEEKEKGRKRKMDRSLK